MQLMKKKTIVVKVFLDKDINNEKNYYLVNYLSKVDRDLFKL